MGFGRFWRVEMLNPLDMQTALLSSYKKDENLLGLAGLLTELGWELLGSAGTVKFLAEHGIEAVDVATIVGEPILGHRVVTLSREVHAGLLAVTPEDFRELTRLGIRSIGFVYVTLYPLEATIADESATPDDVLEKTDIGGPAMLRSAAKGGRIVISDPVHMNMVTPALKGGTVTESVIMYLRAAAESCAANYAAASAKYWQAQLDKLTGKIL